MRRLLAASAVLASVAVAQMADAQRVGSLAVWKKRILDPISLDLAMPAGAAFNMKFTIDQIRLDETTAKMAVYVIALDDIAAATRVFAEQLGTTAETVDRGALGTLHVVRAAPNDPKRAGLTVRVEPAQWATGKGQIWLSFEAPSPAG
jgi:hypothetical protein